MRNALIMASVSFGSVLVLAGAASSSPQTGPCTEAFVKDGRPALADDAFSYMPPYGKPVIGRPAIRDANTRSFSARTNVTRAWLADHRIASTPAGDLAYEFGTLHMGYDEGGKRTEFDAVLLTVFKAVKGACEIAALTMQPLEEAPAR